MSDDRPPKPHAERVPADLAEPDVGWRKGYPRRDVERVLVEARAEHAALRQEIEAVRERIVAAEAATRAELERIATEHEESLAEVEAEHERAIGVIRAAAESDIARIMDEARTPPGGSEPATVGSPEDEQW